MSVRLHVSKSSTWLKSLSSLKQNIDGQKRSILHNRILPSRSCNCRVKTECPMSTNCFKELVVHQATVSTEDHNPTQTYVGLTGKQLILLKLDIQLKSPCFLMQTKGAKYIHLVYERKLVKVWTLKFPKFFHQHLPEFVFVLVFWHC